MNNVRPLIRIAMLVGAWCCGLLFYTFTGRTAIAGIADWGLATCITDWWNSFADTLQARLMGLDMNSDMRGQILALTLGRRDFLSPEIQEMYRTAGASHLLALSGMHLGVLFGILNIFIRNLMYNRWRWVTLAASITLVWSYALMTGCPKSLVRAAMMMSVLLVLQTIGRDKKTIDVLTLSAALIILVEPGCAFDVGFQLSCMAMLGICVVAGPITRNLPYQNWWKKYIIDGLVVSISAQLATLPLTLWYFHSIALYSALTSLLVIPLTTVIIYLSLCLYMGCSCVIPVVGILIDIQNYLMLFIGHLPGAYIVI